jgi:DNA-binding transcriptional regulator LsrR (DeoR family)
MSAAMTRLAPCTVVQLTGALRGPEVDESATELVREAARTGGGPAYFFYAPMIVDSTETAQALRQQPEVARAMAKLPSVTKAVVGVGSWDPPFSTLYDALEPAERESLLELGVRAEVSGILIDADGEPVPSPLAERIIGVEAAQLSRIPEVIAVAYDSTKSKAVVAAVRGGLVNSLITHRSLAEAMLRDVAAAPIDRRPERIP